MLWLMALGTGRGMLLMGGRRQRVLERVLERGLRMGSGDRGAKAVGVLERGQ